MMTWETQQRFLQTDTRFLLFVGSATLLTYYFHALVNTVYEASSERHDWNNRHKRSVLLLTLLTIPLTLLTAWPFRNQFWAMAGAALATFLYSAPNLPFKPFSLLRNIAMGKTIYLALVWTYVTTVMPVLVTQHEMNAAFGWFTLHRFFLILPVCILFDRRDKEEDMAKGVRTLATMTNEKTLRTAYFTGIAISAAAAILYEGTSVAILLIPLLVLLFLYPSRQRERSDVFYFLVLDGLMMLSACLYALIVFVF